MKLSKITKTFYDFIEMTEVINEIIDHDQRDLGKYFYPETGDFNDWCDSKNYGDYDPDGKYRNSSTIWFSEYKNDIVNKKWNETPYLDFWHWQIDNCVHENFRNDSFSKVSISMDLAKDAENWQKDIQKIWYETFKHLADEHGDIDIWVSW